MSEERSHLVDATDELIYQPEFDLENYQKFIICNYCVLLGFSCGMIAPFCWTPCVAETIAEQSNTHLTKNSVHISTAQNDFCFHVARDTQEVPLEQISDVEISRPCLTSCFGLSATRIQHPGNISVGPRGRVYERGVMHFIKNPEEYRIKILEQKNRMKQQQYKSGPMRKGDGGPSGMMMTEDYTKLRPFEKMERLKQYLDLRILTQEEYEEKTDAVRESHDFQLQKEEMGLC
mmetsp:Transcript_38889/g.54223  ORF Transcript_38889/g.54223 Transcript_38889/m.54223 type:complete len:233 (-) Transcript_38889:55-753(-)